MVSKLINMHRIKFVVLQDLFDPIIGNKKRMVNVHIDLHSVLSELYKSSNYEETNWLEGENSLIISSCIINLAAHYRLFFYSKYRCTTRIFLYFGNARPRNNTEFCAEYGYKFFDKYSLSNKDFDAVNVEVTSNLNICKTICSYIPDVHYIDCKSIEPLVAAAYMATKFSGLNVTLTRDEYWYQMVNLPNSIVLRNKRDDSFIVTKDNVYDILLRKSSYEHKEITSDLLSVVYTFGGVKSRDVRGLKGYGYTKIIKVLDKAIDKNLIGKNYTHIKNILDEIYTGDKEELLIDTFKAIDLNYQLNELTMAQKESLNDCIVSKYNKRDLLVLNQKYYTGEYSLMLEELFRGAQDKFKW